MPGVESAAQAFLFRQTKLFVLSPAGQVYSGQLLLMLFFSFSCDSLEQGSHKSFYFIFLVSFFTYAS